MLTTESGIIAIEVLAAQGPVGTRGGVEWMRGPCACPGGGSLIWRGIHFTESWGNQDKHKAQYISLKRWRHSSDRDIMSQVSVRISFGSRSPVLK